MARSRRRGPTCTARTPAHFFFSSRRRHTRWPRDWSSDVCSSDLCGLAVRAELVEAYRQAFTGDPVSAYGGVIACNRAVDAATAEAMGDLFIEVLAAPAFEPDAQIGRASCRERGWMCAQDGHSKRT